MAFKMEGYVLKKYESDSKEETVVIPEGTKVIDRTAFMYRREVKSIVIPDTVEEIGYSAFEESGIKSIVIPDSVTKMGSEIFTECRNLVSVVIGRGITKLDTRTFRSCQSLEHLELPAGVEKIGSDCFEECYTLKKVWVDGVEYSIRDSKAPKPVQLVYDSIEASRMKIVRYYESGLMDEFEYADYQIAGDGYSF